MLSMVLTLIAYKPLKQLYKSYWTWDESYKIYQMGAYTESVESFEEAYNNLSSNGEFLIMFGKALSMAGQHDKAISILSKAKDYQKNTILFTSLGDSYKELGQFKDAERAYLHAFNMIPSRFYPLYLLAKLYNDSGQNEKALDVANNLLGKKEKIHSIAIDEIRNEMESILEKNQ